MQLVLDITSELESKTNTSKHNKQVYVLYCDSVQCQGRNWSLVIAHRKTRFWQV